MDLAGLLCGSLGNTQDGKNLRKSIPCWPRRTWHYHIVQIQFYGAHLAHPYVDLHLPRFTGGPRVLSLLELCLSSLAATHVLYQRSREFRGIPQFDRIGRAFPTAM